MLHFSAASNLDHLLEMSWHSQHFIV